MKVNVTDIDFNLVPEATVTVWNASDLSDTWSQLTDVNGETIFTRFEEGDYIVNVSYDRYGQEISITSAQSITLNATEVDPYGVYHLEFTEVQMTSVEIEFHRVQANVFQELVVGANITFSIDSGSGATTLGSEYSDTNGIVIFRWANFSCCATKDSPYPRL